MLFSEDILQVVTGLSDAFDEAVELFGAGGVELVAAMAFQAGDHGFHKLKKLI